MDDSQVSLGILALFPQVSGPDSCMALASNASAKAMPKRLGLVTGPRGLQLALSKQNRANVGNFPLSGKRPILLKTGHTGLSLAKNTGENRVQKHFFELLESELCPSALVTLLRSISSPESLCVSSQIRMPRWQQQLSRLQRAVC